MFDSFDELKSSRSRVVISRILRLLDARIASAPEQDHPEFPIQEEGKPRGAAPSKEYRILRGRQIAFMIYGYFRVTGAHDTVLDCTDLFCVTLQDGMKFYCPCQRFRPMISWKVCTH